MSRYARERMWIIFVLAVVVCTVMTVVRHTYQKRGVTDPITDLSRRVLFSPALHGSYGVADWWQTDVLSIFRGPELASQNRQLRYKIANLMQRDRILKQQQIENVQLRTLLDFKTRDPRNLLPAEVLSLKPFSERDSAVFSRGLDDRVKLKQPALDQNGNLVGQVIDVSSTTCDILLLTDTLSSVGARVITPQEAAIEQNGATTAATVTAGLPPSAAATAPATVGICVGDHSDHLQLSYLDPDAEIQVGDTVVTSGLGDVYPKDIPIGKVVEVDLDKTRYLKTAIVAPFADFNHIRDGFLIQ